MRTQLLNKLIAVLFLSSCKCQLEMFMQIQNEYLKQKFTRSIVEAAVKQGSKVFSLTSLADIAYGHITIKTS